MTDNEEFQFENFILVNNTKTLSELAFVIKNIGAENNNLIQGSKSTHDSLKMAENCMKLATIESVTERLRAAQCLTRNYGIRQQAMMLLFYNKIH